MVSFKRNGLACKLENDYLSLTMSDEGKGTSLVVDGRELMGKLSGAAGDPDRSHSFYCDYHVAGKTKNLVPTRLEIIEDTPQRVHVAYVDEQSDFKLTYHLVLVDGERCIYGYVIASCDVDNLVINELRTVYRFDSSIFTTGYMARREGLQPRAEYMAEKGERLQDETYRIPDGCRYSNSDVYSKYDYAGTFAENKIWGQYSGGRSDDEWGAWFIPLDKSCYPGGPLKQELLVHYDGIILNYMTGAHFGTGDFKVPKGWKKLYGPWCVYFNHGEDVIGDAYDFAAKAEARLPLPWLEESGLYTGNYGSLEGLLKPVSMLSEEERWTIVATDSAGEYFRQKAGRIYWAQSRDGSFRIDKMQPGIYHLYVHIFGGTDCHEYKLGTYSVRPGEATDVGELRVENAASELIWSLGQYTQTTAPFAFSNQLRNYIWMGLTPKNLEFHMGKDCDADWYYLQRRGGIWKIVFNKPIKKSKHYLLTVCLAGTTAAAMSPGESSVGFRVRLNGKTLAEEHFENDRAAYRSSVTGGRPAILSVEIDADYFDDENELSFMTDGFVMYDMVKLEVLR